MTNITLVVALLAASLQQTPSYDLSVSLTPASRTMTVRGTVRIPVGAFNADSIGFSLTELASDVEAVILDARMRAVPVRLEQVMRPHPRPGWGTVSWVARPAGRVATDRPLLLRVAYSIRGERTSNIFSLGEVASFGAGITTAWYPELDDHPLPPDGGPRGLRGSGAVRFTVPRGLVVHAPGIPRHTRADAARGSFRFEVRESSFLSFAVARYGTVRRQGRVPLTLFQLRARPGIGRYADDVARSLAVLVHEFGAFPHSEFALVEVPDERANNAGFAGASIDGFILATSQFLDQTFNSAYYGHELSHQWWGNSVRARETTPIRIMLSEGMAQYGSLRTVEAIDGAAAAERYRRSGHPGFFDYGSSHYFALVAAGNDWPIESLPGDVNLAVPIINSKGMFVWDMLSRTIGRERFRAVLVEATRRYAGQRVPWATFQHDLERETGSDLDWFWAQWLSRRGAPEWTLAWSIDGDSVRAVVTQMAPFYRATVRVDLVGPAGQRLTRSMRLDGARSEASWAVAFPVSTVVLDPAYEFLRWTPEIRAGFRP